MKASPTQTRGPPRALPAPALADPRPARRLNESSHGQEIGPMDDATGPIYPPHDRASSLSSSLAWITWR
jgi:hypothetical protein